MNIELHIKTKKNGKNSKIFYVLLSIKYYFSNTISKLNI